MFRWAAIFLIVAIIAAIFGFAGNSAATTEVPRICFFVALILSVTSMAAELAFQSLAGVVTQLMQERSEISPLDFE